jgi:deoxyribodipyrimidine photo-lyase
MQALVWYRNDLRVHDHEALFQALAQSPSTLLPVYCFDPRQWGATSFGFRKTGVYRTQFLRESVADLRASLQRLRSDLFVCMGQPEVVIPKLVAQHHITNVFYHEEVASEELAVERRLKQALRANVAVHAFWTHTLYDPEALPFAVSDLPEVFTSFRKQVEDVAKVAPARAVPNTLPPLPELRPDELGAVPTSAELIAASGLPAGGGYAEVSSAGAGVNRSALPFVGGETTGLARMHDYIWQSDCLRRYKETRNGMKSANDSTKLSPWLALGCVSPRRLYENIQDYEHKRVRNDSTYWLVFELLWRDYFRLVAKKHGNRIFSSGGLQRTAIPWVQNAAWFDAWCTGMTGFPLIDANMRELASTGFMSNGGRQNVASFLTKNLGLDFRMGAEWFESLLIDYDVASNWGNWLYAAGVGNDARGFRYFNIPKQARDYDPQGDYVRHWLPELLQIPGDLTHQPERLTTEQQVRYGVKPGINYPMPIVDLEASVRLNEALYNNALNVGKRSRSSVLKQGPSKSRRHPR